MERVEQPGLFTASASVFSTLSAIYVRLVAAVSSGHVPAHRWGEDVAFSDEFERELMNRELHG